MFHLSFGFLLDSRHIQDHWELIFSIEDFFVFFRYKRKTSLRLEKPPQYIYLKNTFFFLNRVFQEIELWLLYFEKFVCACYVECVLMYAQE